MITVAIAVLVAIAGGLVVAAIVRTWPSKSPVETPQVGEYSRPAGSADCPYMVVVDGEYIRCGMVRHHAGKHYRQVQDALIGWEDDLPDHYELTFAPID